MKKSPVFTAVLSGLLFSQSNSQAAVVGVGDGLFNVQLINTSGATPGNVTDNWLSVWNALDSGAGPTGSVAGFNVVNNSSDFETVYDYNGNGGGNFGVNLDPSTINNDGPGGGPGPFGEGDPNDYSLRGRTYLEFNTGGTYTIAMGSDDGRRISLTSEESTGYTGFTAIAGQINGVFSPGDTVFGFSGGTGHNQSLGTFTVNTGDILYLDAFMYEGGGGDSSEISIAQGAFSSFSLANFDLLVDDVHQGAISIHSSVVPEPSSLLSIGIGFLGLLSRRRR